MRSESFSKNHFTLTLDSVDHGFQVLAFKGHEAISQPFAFTLELVSESTALDLESLLNRPSSPSTS